MLDFISTTKHSPWLSVFSQLSDPVVLVRKSGAIIWINPAAESMFHMLAKDIEGEKIITIMDQHNDHLGSLEPVKKLGKAPKMTSPNAATYPFTFNTRKRSYKVLTEEVTIEKDPGYALVFQKSPYEDRRKPLASPKNTLNSSETLTSRELLFDRLNQALAHSNRHQEFLALMLIDLDNFKIINETFGHLVGDVLLEDVGRRIGKQIRADDTLGSIGGDEFIVIFPQISKAADAAKMVRKIIQCFRKPFVYLEKDIYITPSIGITLYPNDGTNAPSLVKNAETAMYHAKRSGGNHYSFFDSQLGLKERTEYQLTLEIRKAIDRNLFELHYQPQINFSSGKITGMEALIRWNHPKLGHISPGQFIPIAEETRLILDLGKWVWREACRQKKIWTDKGLKGFRLAVNVSAVQLTMPNLVQEFAQTMQEEGVTGHHLEIELTESAFLENPDSAFSVIEEFRRLGLTISIDDFGTGFSSLSYIKNINAEVIKIDRAFCGDIKGHANQAIVCAIIAMAKALNITTIAEGVETPAQMEMLNEMGCHTYQGFLFSRPVPSTQATELLEKMIQ